jgi:short-subunit dehydrogenase
LGTSLRPEAARYGVGVTVVCPGPVDTTLLDAVANTDGMDVRRYLTAAGGKPIAASKLADEVVTAVRHDRGVVTPGRAATLRWLNRMAPGAVAKLGARGMRDEIVAAGARDRG